MRRALPLLALCAAACSGTADREADPRAGDPVLTAAAPGDTTPAVAAADSSAAASTVPARPRDPAPATPALIALRGQVLVVGAEPLTHVVIRTGAGDQPLAPGAAATSLARVSGVEVEVRGTRQADGRVAAREFTVRAVGGRDAVDGRLAADGDALVLVTAEGRRIPLANPPAALRAQLGARVWVTRAADVAVESFGVIETP